VVELGLGAIDIPGMEESAQSIIGAVNGPSDKLRNMRRPQEPMLRD
jgi:hypothetical protein